ncbi:Sensory box GGDEF family protein [Vibrio sp. B1ASS3]|uniref:EAL domain-containing protein n=1 Tax=Vibrio sp. B1ASS3 TaxID=2751176 RepID=UPI001AF88E83|nr:hypothetical protein [Vibrio sp. B1ASS3]CAD7818439.1 Sensory box GGDEF family protein [Vibrio sp. B1ASS3]CAE6934720.1 Sensory box GGDEF family protein [Vibrio sp. B1ASS3]
MCVRDAQGNYLSPDVVILVSECCAINLSGQSMGKVTVAEFVENDQVRELLIELGVDYGQGYGIGHPKPLAELVDELQQL